MAVKNITWNDVLLTFIWLDNEWCSTYTWHPHWMKFWGKCNHEHPCFIWHFTFQRWPAWTNQICLKLDVDTKYHPWSLQCSDRNFLLDRKAIIRFTLAFVTWWTCDVIMSIDVYQHNELLPCSMICPSYIITSCRFVCCPVTCNFLPVALERWV